jgi:hypothetical protein
MLALSIRQPYAELILRGIKTVEYRTRPTRIIGERFHIYASKGSGFRVQGSGKAWSRDLSLAKDLPAWMIELAEQVGMIETGTLLPTGVIVGSAMIESCRRVDSCQLPVASRNTRDPSLLATNNSQLTTLFQWHLTDIQRAKRLRKPKGHPQPVWFRPFD